MHAGFLCCVLIHFFMENGGMRPYSVMLSFSLAVKFEFDK